MGLSVADAISLGFLDGCTLLGGKDGLDRNIEVVSVIETPEAHGWALGGELLLTAFYSVMDDPIKQTQLIETMNGKGAAGIIVFYVGMYCKSIDERLIRKADQLGFPLFQALDPQMTYAEVIRPIMAELSLRKLAADVTGAAFEPPLDLNMPEAILEHLSSRLGSTVMLVDSEFHVLGTYPSSHEDDSELIEKWQIKRRYHSQRHRSAMGDAVEVEVDPSVSVLLAPVPSGWNRPPDYVLVISRPGISSDKRRLMLLSISLSMYKILIYKEETDMIESPSRNAYLTNLLTGKINSEDEIIERGRDLGLDMQDKRRVIVVSWKTYETSVNQICQNFLAQAESICFRGHNRLVVICRSGSTTGDDTAILRRNLRRVWVASGEPGWDAGFAIGIGLMQSGVVQLARSYREACDALRVHRILSLRLGYYGEAPLVFYESMRWLLMVEEMASSQAYRDSAHELLAPLRTHDARYGGQLFKTMLVHFWEGCNVARTASKLSIHRNTLNYRLDRIRELFSEDPFGRGNMLKYWLAVGLNIFDPSLTSL